MVSSGTTDIRQLVDAFIAEPKTLEGFGDWQPQGDSGKFIYWRQIQWRGENAAKLQLKAYPRRQQPCFRIILLMERAIWRLDYASQDEPHINSADRPEDLPIGPITGPHFHSWTDNRRFAKKNSLPVKLHNARILSSTIRTFEQAYWWFCDSTGVSISSAEVPELPRSDMLL